MNKQSNHNMRPIGIALIILVLSSLACSVALLDPPGSPSTSDTSAPSGSDSAAPTQLPPELIAQADAEELLLINVYQRVNPSVVNIDVSATDSQGELADLGSGSGFVYDTEGHIVTNYHVVAAGNFE